MVTVMVEGRGKKQKFEFYISPADLDLIDEAVGKGWIDSRAEFLRHAVRHYKDVIRAIFESEEQYKRDECARIRKRIYGDGERKK